MERIPAAPKAKGRQEEAAQVIEHQDQQELRAQQGRQESLPELPAER
jgi:hypothetical protein